MGLSAVNPLTNINRSVLTIVRADIMPTHEPSLTFTILVAVTFTAIAGATVRIRTIGPIPERSCANLGV